MRTQEGIRRGVLSLDGRRVSYLCADGDHGGPTLVFVHGSGMSARYWSAQLHALAGSARVLAVDLPGHGDSDADATPGLSEYADVTAALLDALGRWPALLIGHSLGGAVAITLATQRMADVRGLMLLSTCARLPAVATSVQWLWGSMPAALRRMVFFHSAKELLFAGGASPAAIALGMQELRACRAQTLATDVAIARAMDLRAAAADLRVPTLILCGSRDRITPPALSRSLHATIPGSRLQIVDDAGHMLLMEAPEVVNRAIEAFAASVSQPRPFRTGAGESGATSSETRWRRALQRLVAFVRRR
jgi:pimeloyl-ACP methyl ester carboxylesterase